MKLPDPKDLSYMQHASLGSAVGFLACAGAYTYAAFTIPEFKNYPLDRATTELVTCTVLSAPVFVGLEYFSRMLYKVDKVLHKSLRK